MTELRPPLPNCDPPRVAFTVPERQFTNDNTFKSATQIGAETLLYSTDMPGQPLGHQMGKCKPMQLRGRGAAGRSGAE